MQRYAVVGIGKIFSRQPPGNGVVLHRLQHKARRKWRGVALHHLEMEAAYRLHLPQRKRIGGIGVPEIKVICTPRLCIAVLIALGASASSASA